VSATGQRDAASDLPVRSQNEPDVSPPGDSIQSKSKGYDSTTAPASIYFTSTIGGSFDQQHSLML
jgi:hypothetical protein